MSLAISQECSSPMHGAPQFFPEGLETANSSCRATAAGRVGLTSP